MARNKKVAAFSTRKIRGISGKFGWPSIKNKKDGYFWTNSLDIKKFLNILNNLIKINDKDWLKISRNISNKIMKYDKKNSRLKLILKKWLKTKMYNNKSILITGGTGSFGSKFVQMLTKNINQKK